MHNEEVKKGDIQKFYSEEIYEEFLLKTDIIVKEYMEKYAGIDYHPYPGEKVIHDPIWGSVKFTSSEMKIIDTPLFQRLRDIYQVGLGVYTYPSARHSRFEHSLGVVSIAAKMVDSLQRQDIVKINEYDVNDVRFAALLHDIGHCFYSHLSESFYSKMPKFIELIRYFNEKIGVKPKAHEILSYLIINTNSFKDFLRLNSVFDEKYINESENINTLMSRIGNIIIGAPIYGRKGLKNKKFSFLTSLINGDIDADKLDYIRRDSHTSGLPLTFDIERLLYKITVKEIQNDNYQLVVDIAGITAVEEIVFSKLMLNHYIYHHQKVLATETMAKDICLALTNLKQIKHPTDFLKFTDVTIESLLNDERKPFDSPEYYNCDKELGDFIKRIKNRYLPKRCFEINSHILETTNSDSIKNEEQENERIKNCIREMENIEKEENKINLLRSLAKDLFEFTNTQSNHFSQFIMFLSRFDTNGYDDYTKGIRKEIYCRIRELYKKTGTQLPKSGITIFDIHISVPKTINEQILFSTSIVYRNNEIQTYKISYTKNWAQAFNDNKWSAYVFISPHIDVTIAFKASLFVLERHIKGIKFTTPDYFIKHLDKTMIEKIDKLMIDET